jgi:hypothetical protein
LLVASIYVFSNIFNLRKLFTYIPGYPGYLTVVDEGIYLSLTSPLIQPGMLSG